MTYYYVQTGNDDYYISSGTGTVYTTPQVWVGYNNTITPSVVEVGYARINTSGIGTDTISDADLYIDEYSYTSSRGVTRVYKVWILDSAIYRLLTNGTLTYGASPAVRTIKLTATELTYINKSGYTDIRVTVDDPGAGKVRNFRFKAYETAQANAIRLNVTHAPASTFTPKMMVY